MTVRAWAIDPTLPAPTLSNETAFTMDVDGSVNLGTLETTVNLYVEYKKVVGSTWTRLTTPTLSSTGESAQAITTETLTGLEPETSYNVRFYLDRSGTTNTTKTYVGTAATLTTLPDVPSVTTNPASGVTAGTQGVPNDGTAILHATVDQNSKETEWRFQYGSVAVDDNSTSWTDISTEPEDVSYGLSTLSESTTYDFRCQVRWRADPGLPWTEINGSTLQFTTPGDPLAVAALEDHMMYYQFDRKWGVACDGTNQPKIFFALADESGTSSDLFITDASPFATGDVKISKDGGALANTSNLPAQITASLPLYSLELTATEMEADDIFINIHDASGGPVYRDAMIHIRCAQLLGHVDIDSTADTNTTAFKVSGVGTGHGIHAIGGVSGRDIVGELSTIILHSGECQAHATTGEAKLATTAAGYDDYYNGDIMVITAGTGAGQSRPIIDYDQSTKVVKLAEPWQVQPTGPSDSEYSILAGDKAFRQSFETAEADAELSQVPTSVSSWGDKIQFLFQRFAFKIEQTATTQTWYKSISGTFATRSVDDDGQTQQLGKLT
jgi:hypothetical protein